MPEVYTGLVGSIKKGASPAATAIGHMANWNLNMSREAIPVISFGSDWKDNEPGIKEWDADFDGTVDFSTGSGQAELETAFQAGTKLVYGFYLTETKYFEGTALITELSISNAADGKADISISVVGSGGLEINLPA